MVLAEPTPTYLPQCLKDGRVARWLDSAMPIRVYIAPFRWYEAEKQRAAIHYEQMVLEALAAWRDASGGHIRFQMVSQVSDSQLDIAWRRVDRRTLGHCEYLVNADGVLYSAEVKIGITDGLVHPEYNSTQEVRHTILHEIGHALGLVGHSDHPQDIMYVPHQFGVHTLSPRDQATLQQLYALPVGFDPAAEAIRLKLPAGTDIHTVLAVRNGEALPAGPTLVGPAIQEQPEVLDSHHDILSQMGRFFLATQHIKPPPIPGLPNLTDPPSSP